MEPYSQLLAMLRAAVLIHQTSHWTVKGQSFGGDHELLDEAYSSLLPVVDKLGEICVLDHGDDCVDEEEQCDEMCRHVGKWMRVKDRFDRSVQVEKDLQEQIRKCVGKDGSDLGLDNFLRGLAEARKHPVQYKLGQRVS